MSPRGQEFGMCQLGVSQNRGDLLAILADMHRLALKLGHAMPVVNSLLLQ